MVLADQKLGRNARIFCTDNPQLIPQTTPTLCLLNQHHSNLVCEASEHPSPLADAHFSSKNNQSLVVKTADCIPILLSHQEEPWIAAIHAGWRGLTSGIIRNTIQHAPSKQCFAWIGPHICAQHYDVPIEFAEKHFDSKHWIHTTNKRTHIDLKGNAKEQLSELGISNIMDSGVCTFCHPKIPSYRRNKTTDRLMSIIWRDE